MVNWYAQNAAEGDNFDKANLSDGVYTSTVWNSLSNGSGVWLSWEDWQTITDGYTEGDTFVSGIESVTLNIDITKQCNFSTLSLSSFLVDTSRTFNANFIANDGVCLNIIEECTVVINGNVYGGAAASSTGLSIASGKAVNLTINGCVTAGTGSNAYGLNVGGAGSAVTINNGATVAVVGLGTRIALNVPASSVTLNITGDIIGGSYNGHALSLSGSGAAVNITGNVLGGANGGYGVNLNSGAASSSLTIVGNVFSLLGIGIYSIAPYLIIDITGNISSINGSASAIVLSGATTLTQRDGIITASANPASSNGHCITVTANNCVLNLSGDVYGGRLASNVNGVRVYYAAGTLSFTLVVNGDVYAGTAYLSHGISVTAVAIGTFSITVNGNVFNNDKALGVAAPYTLGNSNQFYLQNPIAGGSTAKFAMQLDAEKVIKGQVHGDVIGTLAPASPFRRLNRFV